MIGPRRADHDTDRLALDAADPLADLLTAWRAELDTVTERYIPQTVAPETVVSETNAPDRRPARVLRFPRVDGGWRRRSAAVAVAVGVVLGTSGVAAAVVSPAGALGLLRDIPIVRTVVPGGTDTARVAQLLDHAASGIAAAEAAGGVTPSARTDISTGLDQAAALLDGVSHPSSHLRSQLSDLRAALAALPSAPGAAEVDPTGQDADGTPATGNGTPGSGSTSGSSTGNGSTGGVSTGGGGTTGSLQPGSGDDDARDHTTDDEPDRAVTPDDTSRDDKPTDDRSTDDGSPDSWVPDTSDDTAPDAPEDDPGIDD